jgi:hypothetical protein
MGMFGLKILVICLAILHPLIFIFIFGERITLSSYWDTSLQPLFIVSNAATSYFLFSLKHWKLPSLFLLLLTAFPVYSFPLIHNILAGLFFIGAGAAILNRNRSTFKNYSILYFSVIILFFKSWLWAEIAAIWVLCLYHLNILLMVEGKTKKSWL